MAGTDYRVVSAAVSARRVWFAGEGRLTIHPSKLPQPCGIHDRRMRSAPSGTEARHELHRPRSRAGHGPPTRAPEQTGQLTSQTCLPPLPQTLCPRLAEPPSPVLLPQACVQEGAESRQPAAVACTESGSPYATEALKSGPALARASPTCLTCIRSPRCAKWSAHN
jgi:hypothetical protein